MCENCAHTPPLPSMLPLIVLLKGSGAKSFCLTCLHGQCAGAKDAETKSREPRSQALPPIVSLVMTGHQRTLLALLSTLHRFPHFVLLHCTQPWPSPQVSASLVALTSAADTCFLPMMCSSLWMLYMLVSTCLQSDPGPPFL